MDWNKAYHIALEGVQALLMLGVIVALGREQVQATRRRRVLRRMGVGR